MCITLPFRCLAVKCNALLLVFKTTRELHYWDVWSRIQFLPFQKFLEFMHIFISFSFSYDTAFCWAFAPLNGSIHVQDYWNSNYSLSFDLTNIDPVYDLQVLKQTLIRHGFKFESETDTEVIPKLAKFVFDQAYEGLFSLLY